MVFRDREKKRLVPLKPCLFSPEACIPGTYQKKERDFCLSDDFSDENIHAIVRENAISYFSERDIPWHKGINGRPSNHLCCSQSFCVNVWFPFIDKPDALLDVLKGIGYPAKEVLPFTSDSTIHTGEKPFLSFEWIGDKNYLGELRRGVPAGDSDRSRGQNFTSADFAFRFLRDDGKIQVVLGEWKYTENYTWGKSIRISGSGKDRLTIYGPHLEHQACQIRLGSVDPDWLFYDPFDQLMRLQLLASMMEHHHEMDAEIVSVLHIAPIANKELTERITSPYLRDFATDIHLLWAKLVTDMRFQGFHAEQLIPILSQSLGDEHWGQYMESRYGGMK